MEYKLAEVKSKIDQMSDKLGSDYFPLTEVLNVFYTACYDFIGNRLKHIEKNQEIVDDIRLLITDPVKLEIIEAPSLEGGINSGRYIAGVPVNYHRLVSHTVLYQDGTKCRRSDLKRHGELEIANTSPFRKPTKQYPHIIQKASTWEIDSGDTIPAHLLIVYCKKPTIATTGEPNTRIVNLPDDVIERILLNSTKYLFQQTGDQRYGTSSEIENAFRKTFA